MIDRNDIKHSGVDMLPEVEIRERAIYCYSVFLQLSWLCSNAHIEPSQYLGCLQKSSLGIGDDEFVVSTIEESLLMEQGETALRSLITLYEGFTGAFCEVLEIAMDDLMAELSQDTQKKLAMEVGVHIKL